MADDAVGSPILGGVHHAQRHCPARVRQVLHNLLGNAVKFTKSGLVVLKVQRQGDLFSFEVRDTGPGISAKDAAHIFDAFRQADDSATRPADGTGLGLTIAREIAQAMGGVSGEVVKYPEDVHAAVRRGIDHVLQSRRPYVLDVRTAGDPPPTPLIQQQAQAKALRRFIAQPPLDVFHEQASIALSANSEGPQQPPNLRLIF